jgi:uncharacterized membrane protein YheB (UPF0754 family)
MNPWLLLLPAIAAFTGWLIIRAFVWALFRPQLPTRLAGISLQGILPRTQSQLAGQLGKWVSTHFISFDQLAGTIGSAENLEKLMPMVETQIDQFLREKLAQEMPMISMFIGDKTIGKVKAVFMDELRSLFPKLMEQYATTLSEKLDIEKLVAEKVAALNTADLELALQQHWKKPINRLYLMAILIGFVMGLLQLTIAVLSA